MSNSGGLSAAVIEKAAAGRPAAVPAAPPVAVAPPAVTRDEVDVLVRRAGLNLNAGQKADLAVSYQHIVALTARIPRARPIWDEPCFTLAFGAATAPTLVPASGDGAARPAAKASARPAPRPAAKPAKAPARAAKAAKPAPARAKAAKKPARPAPKPARKAARPRR
jgi:hypothetical protein